MCGRTTLTITPGDFQRAFGFEAPAGYRPRYNIAPSQEVLALASDPAGTALRRFRWGLVPFWAKDATIGNRLINARSETVAVKPAFRAAFSRRRCLVLVDGWYEWEARPGGKLPHRICLRKRDPFTLAGIWERWDRGAEPVESCALLTTSASPAIRRIHDRMPVIVRAEERSRWLSPGATPEEVQAMLAPYPGDDLEAYAVATVVNRPGNDVPGCIEPVPETDPGPAQQPELGVV